ncbi:replicative DNA helicase [Actinopolyspora mzabensis]|uniref:Replicative DNA helicase n=1 Tax=Actinopolyspora mzabensis TaxID=995066 RepID=A0A1G8X5L4_ACTMZ|nr:replicative DNA helicase [Actinopolyspora mzabensis]SDJ85616.1 replicative DNA helicase [Actinopolyspora mzabensis]
MALADERGTEPPPDENDGDHGAAFERQPPQDVAAEQSVLGGMMLSKDAIANVVEVLQPQDFYRPAHHVIYECVLDLYGRGEPADAVTVSAALERRNELGKVGGGAYIHTLLRTVPTAANANYYAEIVSEKAVLRRLVEAGTRIVQYGYNGAEGAAIEEVVDRAQAAVYDVTERRTSEDYVALEELLQPTMDEIDAIASRGGESEGIPTGFVDLDGVTNGLHPGQMIIVAARPGVGKALALHTPLPTPEGWTTMGAVSVGDQLLGADGRSVRVTAATEVMHGHVCYEIEFSDGTLVVADEQHQWGLRDGTVCTTAGLRDRLGNRMDVELPDHGPFSLAQRDLPIAPYLLGVWLAAGDKAGELSGVGEDVLANLEPATPEPNGLVRANDGVVLDEETAAELAGLGVWHEAEVPADYLRGSEQQRRSLLAGLADTAGSVGEDGRVLLRVRESLSVRVRELVLTLGYPCTATVDPDSGDEITTLVVFDSGEDQIFRRTELDDQHKLKRGGNRRPRGVRAVRRVDSVPVRCVEVDSPDRLYLASRSMIPTHNSTLGLDFARAASIRNGLGSVIFSLEMGRTEIVMRMLSAEARIRLGDMRGGRMTDEDWTRLARRMSEINEAPLFIDDSPNLTMMEIRAKARRLKQRNDIGLIVVDYMQLMTSGKRVESRQQEVSEFSRSLKLLAKELEIPVVAISQLNRGPEQRNDRKPQLSDLRESGCLTGGTRLLRADDGSEITFDELMAEGQRPLVWSVDEQRRMVPRPITNVFSSGVKEAFRVVLASGREVEATANHPMLTPWGWTPLGELTEGAHVAVPGRVPDPLDAEPVSESEVVSLARSALDGGEVPHRVFSLPRGQLALFLRLCWDGEGSAAEPRELRAGWERRTVKGRALADGFQLLLSRFTVHTRLRRPSPEADPNRWEILLDGIDSRQRFAREIAGAEVASREIASTAPAPVARAGGSLEPGAVAVGDGTFSADRRERAVTTDAGSRRNEVPSDEVYSDDVRWDDVRWDEIVEITSLGEQPVYDATVADTHNFVANSVVVHNSLEQDADMVILIHRPDAFERDDPRMGEADLILAKHRAGPTETVTVAHQLHYSRFVDMAQE